MKHKRIALVFIVLVLVASILACGGSAAPTATVPPTQPPPTQPPAPTNTPVPPPPTDTAVPPTEPPAAEPTADTSGTTAPNIVAGQINIVQVTGYKDSWDDWHIVGLVSNNTARAVNDIEIEVEILDANGASLYKETAYADLWSLAPEEISTFDVWVYEDLPTADTVSAVVVGNGTTELERATVDFQNVSMVVDDYDDIYLTGELVNNGSQPISIDGLSAALFDDAGSIVTSDSSYTMRRYLDPGDSGPFRITLDAPEGQAASLTDYTFYTDVGVEGAAEVYDLTLSEDHYSYIDAYDNFHLVGTVTNNSSEALNVSLVAGLYDAAGNCLDAASLSLPVYSLAPGETMAYDFDGWGPVNYASGTYDAADSYRVVVDWNWTYTSYSEVVDIVTVEANDANDYDGYQLNFTGQVLNNSGRDLTGATVIVVIYDKASGQVIATDYGWIFDDIVNNASADYEVAVYLPEGFDINSAEYEILVKGDLP
ncbi:MAG TPA: FxLYD domain-containing protein [Anaerolineales bacterium]|nr:FxLYD domain-containing protein [Anaerolineales bacterium]